MFFQVIKVISRIAHMISSGLLAGLIILNYLFNFSVNSLIDSKHLKLTHMICGIVLIVTGVANIFLIKGRKKLLPVHKKWLHLLEFKLMLALLLTPLADPLLTFYLKITS